MFIVYLHLGGCFFSSVGSEHGEINIVVVHHTHKHFWIVFTAEKSVNQVLSNFMLFFCLHFLRCISSSHPLQMVVFKSYHFIEISVELLSIAKIIRKLCTWALVLAFSFRSSVYERTKNRQLVMVEQNRYEVYMVNKLKWATKSPEPIIWIPRRRFVPVPKLDYRNRSIQINECDFNMENVLSIAKSARFFFRANAESGWRMRPQPISAHSFTKPTETKWSYKGIFTLGVKYIVKFVPNRFSFAWNNRIH